MAENDVEELRRDVEQLRMALARSAGVETRAPARNTLPGTSLKMILLSLAVLLPIVVVFFILVLGSWWISGPWNGIPVGVTLGGLDPLLDPLASELGPLLEGLTGLLEGLDGLLSGINTLMDLLAKPVEFIMDPLDWIRDLRP